MTSTIRFIIVFFCSLIFSYLCAAFVQWELNPEEWSEMARAMLIWFGVGMSTVFAVFSLSV